MAVDFFTGPPDPRDVRAQLRHFSQRHSEDWVARVWIEDGSDAEGAEVVCTVSDSLRCTHPLDAATIERTVAAHINLLWPRGYRLVAERARAELGGEYALGGDSESLYLVEQFMRVPA
jgi:hypothetical protein